MGKLGYETKFWITNSSLSKIAAGLESEYVMGDPKPRTSKLLHIYKDPILSYKSVGFPIINSLDSLISN